MKCRRCPLYHSWSNESDRGESCGLFGDGWDNDLQYEDKEGCTVGCYVDRHYIENVDRRYLEHLDLEATAYENWMISTEKEDDDGRMGTDA